MPAAVSQLPGLAAVFALLALFWLRGGEPRRFAWAAIVVVLVFLPLQHVLGRAPELPLWAAALVLQALALALAATVLRRSVSLHFLGAAGGGAAAEARMREEILARVPELVARGLARRDGEDLAVTTQGLRVARTLGRLQRWLGVAP